MLRLNVGCVVREGTWVEHSRLEWETSGKK